MGLTFNDPVPDHSTFSKNRHGRFKESNLFGEIFDEVVRLCFARGLLTGNHLTVDNTLVEADASLNSLEPIVIVMSFQEYLEKLEKENPVEDESNLRKGNNSAHRSKVGPDARLWPGVAQRTISLNCYCSEHKTDGETTYKERP